MEEGRPGRLINGRANTPGIENGTLITLDEQRENLCLNDLLNITGSTGDQLEIGLDNEPGRPAVATWTSPFGGNLHLPLKREGDREWRVEFEPHHIEMLKSVALQEMRVTISLLPSSDDAALYSAEYQAELSAFVHALRLEGVRVISQRMYFQDSAESVTKLLGEFTVAFAVGIGTAIGAWLQARYGRKVRLTIDGNKIDAQAGSVEEVDSLIKRAEEHQKSMRAHRPKSRPKSDGTKKR